MAQGQCHRRIVAGHEVPIHVFHSHDHGAEGCSRCPEAGGTCWKTSLPAAAGLMVMLLEVTPVSEPSLAATV